MLKKSAALALIALAGWVPAAQGQDTNAAKQIEQGATAYRICAACHSLEEGVHLSGPSLSGLWGKKAAAQETFGRYTEALKGLDIVWDADTLNAWLADPRAMAPGTTMTFRGIEEDDTRGNLIAFLREAMAEGGRDRVAKRGLIPEHMAAGQVPPDLSSVEANQRIAEISHCRDGYSITTADGAAFPFWETNVRIKIDTSARGPNGKEPVLVRSGMVGDRVSVVFSSLEQLRAHLKEKC